MDAAGKFVSERNVDQCCNDTWNGSLTADRLERYLESDRSIIDSPGGEQHLTPLAATCASGHPEAVDCSLLEAPTPLHSPCRIASIAFVVSNYGGLVSLG